MRLLDIIRNFWSLTSYVDKSPINNMRRFIGAEFQLMLTRGMRVTAIRCRPWMLHDSEQKQQGQTFTGQAG